jgi:DNA polymerase-3 subunit gamma/tau
MPDKPDIIQSLYRTYRPQTFEQVRGQAHVARTLTNAVRNGTVAHGYVFAGPRGTGKTSTARILAKALNCVGPDDAHRLTAPTPTPCGVCYSCTEVAAGSSLDVIEMDAASNRSIDDVRGLRDTVAFAPIRDRFKVYIIDEAHMLTREAFNALLKTLEEPPANVVFVLATTEPHKLPDTIVSRCQRFDFHRPTAQQIVELLTEIAAHEGIDTDEDALATIAEHSQGGFRDAIGALDRLRSFADGRVRADDVLAVLGVTDTQLLLEITDIVADRDTAAALAFVHRLYERGTNYAQFISDLLRHLRRLFLLQHLLHASSDPALLRALGQNVGLHPGAIALLEPQAHQLSPAALVRFMDLLGHAQGEIKAGLDARLQLELTLVKLTRPHLDLSLESLDERLQRLEEGRAPAGGMAPAGARTPSTPAPARTTPPATEADRPASATPEAEAAPVIALAPAVTPPTTDAPAAAGAAPAAATTPPSPGTSPSQAAAGRGGPDTPIEKAAAPAQAAAPVTQAAAPQQPQPAAAPADEPADDSLERATRAWPRVLERAQQTGGAMSALLRDTMPLAVEGDQVTVGVTSTFVCEKLRAQGSGGALAEALAEVLGRPVQVHYEGVAASAAEPTPALTDAQRIALIQKELEAELLTNED